MAITVVLVYFVVIIAIGLYARRRAAASTDEFFVAGGTIGTFTNSWAFLATLASGGTIMAAVGMTVFLGLPYTVALAAGGPVGFAMASILVARPMRRVGRYTVPDLFRARFDSAVIRWAAPVVIVIASTVYMVSQITVSGIIATALLGWPHEIGVLVTGGIFILYTALGGFLSVTWNDVFQGFLMVGMTVAFAIIAIVSVPSFTDVFVTATVEFPSYGAVGEALPVWSYVGGFVTSATTICILPHVIMRVYSARNARSARLSLNYAMILYGVIILAVTLVLAPVSTTLPGVREMSPDTVFFALSGAMLSPFMQGMIAAAVLAAVMSTTAGLLMACNSAIANDLYARILRPGATQRQTLLVATVTTWVVGIVATLFALDPPEFLVLLYIAAMGFLSSAFFAPMVLGIWWRRCTSAAAAAGLVVGAASYAVVFLALDMPSSSEILVGIPMSFLAVVVVALAGPAPTAEEVAVAERAHAPAGPG
ncbi:MULTISPECIES: sodium:solute symporter family protein [Pseudonocardia]|uniref:Cation/acetate symporter ActP n=2 Tax=Pseudonocardia TaxID=1847 RepID=A0A1Y2NAP5_PSEAH|nr:MULTISPECIES: hypothetical protein [Pseudonocardia]OSY44229.1 Cation/acetate symporter ActP [Pseudonocardia autotrophica]TDN74041.1 SSS family transporter [Pseudonocardia autotrophica]BBG04798.1 sodium/panthothenate symporter [Pseudonocardia autotrophica]GEC23454.1 sodium/panthothenate symporter [Pseudonocardia saturnea]